MSVFRNLYALLIQIFKINNKNWLGQIIAGSGIGLATTVGLTAFVDYYKTKALLEFGKLGAFSGLLGLAGIDKAISVILGAYVCSVYIKTFASSLRVVRK